MSEDSPRQAAASRGSRGVANRIKTLGDTLHSIDLNHITVLIVLMHVLGDAVSANKFLFLPVYTVVLLAWSFATYHGIEMPFSRWLRPGRKGAGVLASMREAVALRAAGFGVSPAVARVACVLALVVIVGAAGIVGSLSGADDEVPPPETSGVVEEAPADGHGEAPLDEPGAGATGVGGVGEIPREGR